MTISHARFEQKLYEILRNKTGEELVLEVPNIYSDVSEYYNNQVIDEISAESGDEEE